MNRNDKSNFLLYIEPTQDEKSLVPIDDDVTKLLTMALLKSKEGVANYSSVDEVERFTEGGYRGFHITDCGKYSSNHDYELQNGMITNNLAPFYASWYRESISLNDWEKIIKLGKFYNINI
jgi:hypothetical protein